MPVNADVAPVTNLFREVCGIKDELWLEEGVLAVLCQKTKIQGKVEVPHGFVDETSMTRLISALQHIFASVPRHGCRAGTVNTRLTIKEKISATAGLVFFSRRPSSLYKRNPENSAVQERSRNSMNIFLVSPVTLSAALLKESLRTK